MKIKSGIEQPYQAMEFQGCKCLSAAKFRRKMIEVAFLEKHTNLSKAN